MSKTSFFYRSYNIDPNSLIPAFAAASSLKSPRLTHHPTANTLSTGHKLKHYPINIALVTRPEGREGRSQAGPTGRYLEVRPRRGS